MTYYNLLQDYKSCLKHYRELPKAEKESEEGLMLFDKIEQLHEELKELESIIGTFQASTNQYS